MRLEDLTDDQLGAHVRDRHTRLRAAFKDGLTKHDPDETFNHQSRLLRACRELKGNVGSSKEIELNGTSEQEQALGQDDPPATPGTPRVQRPGTPTMDSMERLVPGYGRLGGGGKTFVHDREDDGVTLKTTGRLR
jgi:hypothetical protein